MGLQAIGAGLPRTGTTSLKGALEQLFHGPCYHMTEFYPRAEQDWSLWWAAFDGDLEALANVTADWTAAVDWPASILWRELAEIYPEAPVILSHRGGADTWWHSVDATVWESMRVRSSGPIELWNDKLRASAGLGQDWDDKAVACAFYDAHIAEVTKAIEPERLLVWQAAEGWRPLCDLFGLAEPAGDFLHENTTAEFIERREAYIAESEARES